MIVVEIFGDLGTECLMTIQIVPKGFQINGSQNVREAAKISGAISFPYLENKFGPKYLKESEIDKMFFLSETIHIQENESRGTKWMEQDIFERKSINTLR